MLFGLPGYCVKYTVGHVHCLGWDEGGDDSKVPSALAGSCAYACQCSWVTVRESQECSAVGNLKWVCGGHTDNG